MTQGKTPSEAEVYTNSDLERIGKWAKENKIQFNKFRSNAMLMSRKRSSDNINIYLNTRGLEQVEEIKYLGIYFDSRLTFDKHIENIAEKFTTLMYMLGKPVKLQ